MNISDFIQAFPEWMKESNGATPWQITASLPALITKMISGLSSDFKVTGNIAIHSSAIIEDHAVLKGPLIISEHCFVAAHAYLRNGVYLGNHVSLGPGCEVKSSCLFTKASLAHFNFVGDSIIGARVNLEAGAVIANHYNERDLKEIEVIIQGMRIRTGTEKFGALVGDGSKIGANAVLSPGTVLPPNSIIRRLELVQQTLI